MINIRKLENELWESADLLRSGSKLTSNQYCMPVLGLIFLRYAFSRYKKAEEEILKNRPSRGGKVLPVEASDFSAKSALYLPKEAQYDFLVNLPNDISSSAIKNKEGHIITSLGEAVNNAMSLVEDQSEQLKGVLPKSYTDFSDEILAELLRIFNNSALNDVGGDVIGRIYEYFLNKFAKNIASDDGVFFTPKSLVKMIVNVLEPKSGVLLDPACGSGGMFVQSGDFVNSTGMNANGTMTFYGQEKVEYNAQLCLMNMAVHGLTGVIKSGDEANTFYHDAHNLNGECDYIMANPPFNVDKVKAESAENAGRLPFGMPAINKNKEVGNGNYLWISYFYSYLNEKGRAGFVMASSATNSQGKDKDIREKLIKTGNVDVMMSVGNNFFYTKALPCSLWFFDKGKKENIKNNVLFIDARNYYTVVDRTLNEWTERQLKNLNSIVWLYRGEKDKYLSLVKEYEDTIPSLMFELPRISKEFALLLEEETAKQFLNNVPLFSKEISLKELKERLKSLIDITKNSVKQTQGIVKSRSKKALEEKMNEFIKHLEEIINIIDDYYWLIDKFGEGTYKDVLGLCKIADTSEIKENDWSLNPGTYVGISPAEEDGIDFKKRINEIHKELLLLQNESNDLMNTISNSFEEISHEI